MVAADRRNLLLLTAAWIAAVLLVDPRGEFPILDDWAYVPSVRMLVEQHRLVYHDWAAANLLTHFLWGALFGELFGVSYFTMRLSTLVAAWLGAIIFYRLARLLPASPGVALLAAALWLFNPLSMNVSFAFMSDIIFATLTFGALLLLVEARRRDDRGLAAGGWLLGLAAQLDRQTGVALPLGWAAAGLATPSRLSPRRLLSLIAPAILFGIVQAGFNHWLAITDRKPLFFGRQTGDITDRIMHDPAGSIGQMIALLPSLSLYFGLLGWPMAIAVGIDRLARQSQARRIGLGALAAGLTIALVALGLAGVIPLPARFTLGTALPAEWMLSWRRMAILVVTTALGVIVSIPLTIASWRAIARLRDGDIRARTAVEALAIGVALLSATMLVSLRFDRYLIPIFGCVLLLLAALPGERGLGRVAAIIGGGGWLVLAAASILLQHDALAERRVRTRAFDEIATKVGAAEVDGGWVLNGLVYFKCFVYAPDQALDGWLHSAYVVEPAWAARPGYDVVASLPVVRWLPFNQAAGILVEHDPANRTYSSDPAINLESCRSQ